MKYLKTYIEASELETCARAKIPVEDQNCDLALSTVEFNMLDRSVEFLFMVSDKNSEPDMNIRRIHLATKELLK